MRSPLTYRLPAARACSEGGFTLVEVLVAMFILLVGIVAAFGVFSSSKNASLASQRQEIAVHQAQREMERLRAFQYAELGLTATPVASTDPNNPNNKVLAGNKFRVKTSPVLDEDLVLKSTGDAPSAQINPGPEAFTDRKSVV